MANENYRKELVGVFGDPVDGNPTCVVEDAAFAAAGINWSYLTCLVKVEDLGAAIAGMKAINMRGVNLTMPHKIEVLKYIDELTPGAAAVGAVNTIAVKEDGRLLGENTDGKGFVQALKDENIPIAGSTVTVLGAGGAARAIAMELGLAGAKSIYIINRTVSKGEALAKAIPEKTGAEAKYLPWEKHMKIPEGTQILVNATSIGLFPNGNDCPDIDFETVHEGMTVSDVVFNPVMPPFLKNAEARGAHIITGIGMLVNQAALNFKLWTGLEADRKVMMDALVKEFEKA